MNFSSFTLKTLTAALVLASTTGLALAKNYKGEPNYKGESMAAPCPAPATLKDGFYLGVQAGYDSYRVRQSINSPSVSQISGSPVLNATGWVGGLLIGYGQYITDMFYLGGEVFGNVSNADESYSLTDVNPTGNTVYSSKFEVNGSYGLALLPGIKVNDTTLGYLRLGWNWASLKAKESASTATEGGSASKSNTSNGFNIGLGMETLVYDNWSVRGEVSHTYYNSFNTGLGSKFNPSDNQALLAVLYHFA